MSRALASVVRHSGPTALVYQSLGMAPPSRTADRHRLNHLNLALPDLLSARRAASETRCLLRLARSADTGLGRYETRRRTIDGLPEAYFAAKPPQRLENEATEQWCTIAPGVPATRSAFQITAVPQNGTFALDPSANTATSGCTPC